MYLLLTTVFISSLLGSVHCVGMCGPFALMAGSSSTGDRRPKLAPTAAYSFGRLITYTIVGVIFGFAGMALNLGTSFANWQQSATYVAGALMILVGVIALIRQIGVRVRLPKAFKPMQKLLKAGFDKTKSLPPVSRAFAIGALSSLMPCGWLYTFAITAAGTGSPWWGGAVMMVFWAGTVPIMTALILGFNRIGQAFQKRIPVAMATLVIAIGFFTLAYRAPVALGADANVVTDTEQMADHLRNLDHSTLPCCNCESDQSSAAADGTSDDR
jgi:sulfite exporter TauE/SafE